MKKTCKFAFFALFWLVLALSFAPVPALAVTAIDGAARCTLTVEYRHEGAAIPGAHFSIYRAADVSAEGGFSLSGGFAGYPVLIDGLTGGEWGALAETLAGYAQRDGLTALDSGVTDSQGRLTFPTQGEGLAPGLYLVLGQAASDGTGVYAAEPFLVTLPGWDETSGGWQYDLTAAPKNTRRDVPTAPGETVTLRVFKIWADQDDSAARPQTLTVTLLKNGAVFGSAALSAQNNWRWGWSGLPKYDETGLSIDWRVVEEAVPGYTVSIARQGDDFFITNTKTADAPAVSPAPADDSTPTEYPTPTESGQPAQPSQELPQTGALWWPVPLLAGAGLVSLSAGAFLMRRAKH